MRSAGGRLAFSVTSTVHQSERAFRILDALVKGVEQAGHRVQAGDESYGGKPTRLVIGGRDVTLVLRERLKRVPHVPSKKDFLPRDWDDMPCGLLRLTMEWDTEYRSRQMWEESSKSNLESQLDEIFLSILNVAPLLKALDAERAERRRIAEEAAERRRVAEAKRQEEHRLDNLLVQHAAQWDRARLVRRFARHITRELERGNAPGLTDSGAAWLARAERVASLHDPTSTVIERIRSPDTNDGEDEDVFEHEDHLD